MCATAPRRLVARWRCAFSTHESIRAAADVRDDRHTGWCGGDDVRADRPGGCHAHERPEWRGSAAQRANFTAGAQPMALCRRQQRAPGARRPRQPAANADGRAGQTYAGNLGFAGRGPRGRARDRAPAAVIDRRPEHCPTPQGARVRAGAAGGSAMRWMLAGLAALPLMQARAQVPLVGGPPATESASQGPVFSPFVEETVATDDNVFRISDRANPMTLIGYPFRSDTYLTTSVGLTADVPVSLQHFEASLAYNIVHYDRFRDLDYDGYNLHGSWLWQLGSSLSGEVGVTDSYSLEPFAELLGVHPDRLHLREGFAKGSWLITPDYKLYLGGD